MTVTGTVSVPGCLPVCVSERAGDNQAEMKVQLKLQFTIEGGARQGQHHFFPSIRPFLERQVLITPYSTHRTICNKRHGSGLGAYKVRKSTFGNKAPSDHFFPPIRHFV